MKSFKLNLSVIVLAGITLLTAHSMNASIAPMATAHDKESKLDLVIYKTEFAITRCVQFVTACINKSINGNAAFAEIKHITADIRSIVSIVPLITASELDQKHRDLFYLKLNVICNEMDSLLSIMEAKRGLPTRQFIADLEAPINKLKNHVQEIMPILQMIKIQASDNAKTTISNIEAHATALHAQLLALGKLQAYSVIKNLQA